MKTFDDGATYLDEIQKLVPGHALFQELVVATLVAHTPTDGVLGVVGPGPGSELVDLAHALPGWSLEAIEPAPAMAASACARIREAGLDERIQVYPRPLQPEMGSWDAAVCILVAHLIPDDGARAGFWSALGTCVRPGGLLLTAEIEAVDEPTRATWDAWAAARGLDETRRTRLRERLSGGFACLPGHRTAILAESAGFLAEARIASALGVTLRTWRRLRPIEIT